MSRHVIPHVAVVMGIAFSFNIDQSIDRDIETTAREEDRSGNKKKKNYDSRKGKARKGNTDGSVRDTPQHNTAQHITGRNGGLGLGLGLGDGEGRPNLTEQTGGRADVGPGKAAKRRNA